MCFILKYNSPVFCIQVGGKQYDLVYSSLSEDEGGGGDLMSGLLKVPHYINYCRSFLFSVATIGRYFESAKFCKKKF